MSENIPDFKLAIFDLRSGTARARVYSTVRRCSAEFYSAVSQSFTLLAQESFRAKSAWHMVPTGSRRYPRVPLRANSNRK